MEILGVQRGKVVAISTGYKLTRMPRRLKKMDGQKGVRGREMRFQVGVEGVGRTSWMFRRGR
jgi:hypothetical protein